MRRMFSATVAHWTTMQAVPSGRELDAKLWGWRTLVPSRARFGEVARGSTRSLGRRRRRLDALGCRMLNAGRRRKGLPRTTLEGPHYVGYLIFRAKMGFRIGRIPQVFSEGPLTVLAEITTGMILRRVRDFPLEGLRIGVALPLGCPRRASVMKVEDGRRTVVMMMFLFRLILRFLGDP